MFDWDRDKVWDEARARQVVWTSITSFTWLTLLVSIVGVTIEHAPQLDPDLVKGWVTTFKHLISVFGILVIGLTLGIIVRRNANPQ